MATIVMYCTLPTKGGSTNFRNAGVHVKPVKGAAVFFSYINPETLVMDDGFTEHSGCPVFEGEKKIVTQWVRLGVDAENSWDTFNTRECILLFYACIVISLLLLLILRCPLTLCDTLVGISMKDLEE